MYINKIAAVERNCVACGLVFRAPAHINQIRCHKDCGRTTQARNKARTETRAIYAPRFVGIDGEGVNNADGSHPYVLLSVGERSLHREGANLHCGEIFEFLWECFTDDPGAVYVGYYLKYDFGKWFATLPQDRAAMLFNPASRARTASGGNATPFPVYWDHNGLSWEFDILGMKRFKLRQAGSRAWLNICDVGGFFQQTFVGASAMYDEKGKPNWTDTSGKLIEIATPEDMAIIEEGKARRADAKFDKAMIRYNCAENRVLARMMETMAQGFCAMQVELKKDQWYGPGQVAQKWMDANNSHSAKALKERAQREPIFQEAMNAARQSYYGGWFEQYAHGHIRGRTYEYDIASAYPHIQSNLPCLLHGDWEYFGDNHASDEWSVAAGYVLVRASVEGSNPYIGAMLHRDKSGKINRPNYSSGWYWKHELEAAQRAGLIDTIICHEGYIYTPCACPPPMLKLRDLYAQRLAVGKSTPQGRGLKLGYNSCYGKTAQSIGNPKYANPIHASLITAGCRTMILDAIATHPVGAGHVLMIATDGIYFASPHPGLQNQPPELGNWEESYKENMTIFLPGVYWDDKARAARAAKVVKLKSRGVSGTDLIAKLDALDAEFDRMLNEPIPGGVAVSITHPDWWAKLDIQIKFSMVSPKQALARGKWETAGEVTQGGNRTLWAHPRHKRELVFAPTPERPYIHTSRPSNVRRLASVPYSRLFGMELESRLEVEDVTTPEGNAMDIVAEIIEG